MGLVVDRESSRGFEQWAALGLEKPKLALSFNLEARYRVGPVLRLGAAGGLVSLGTGTTHIDSVYLESVLVVGTTRWRPSSSVLSALDVGLRVTGGGGRAIWHWKDDTEQSGLYRLSAALDVGLFFGRRAKYGVGIRLGWAHMRTGKLGPLDLRFDLSGPFTDIGCVLAW